MKQKGFTLIELMIVLLIMGVLAALAFPAISGHDIKARRAVAKSILLEISSKEEEWFVNNKSYTGNLADLGYPSPLSINDNGNAVEPIEGFYSIGIAATQATYTLQAMPLHRQAKDLECATLGISNTGVKTASGKKGAEACW